MAETQDRCKTKTNALTVWFCLMAVLAFASCTAKTPGPPEVKPLVVASPAPSAAPQELTLGPEDKISITVWRNSEFDGSLTIGPSGTISMPMIGEIHASGMTSSQLAGEIEARLSKYIKDPAVAVNVVSIGSQKVHVLGQVRSPGTFSYMERMAAWEAVSRAGGFNDDANTKRLLLIRMKSREATISILPMNFEQIFKDGRIGGNYYLNNGDVLYVAEKKISSVEKFMVRLNNLLAPIMSLQRMISITPNMIDALEGDTAGSVLMP